MTSSTHLPAIGANGSPRPNLLTEAAELAQSSPCDPKTLTRATRELSTSNPEFARPVGLAALKWLLCGYGYDITTLDIVNALDHTLEAARNSGSEADTSSKSKGLSTNTQEQRAPSSHSCAESSAR